MEEGGTFEAHKDTSALKRHYREVSVNAVKGKERKNEGDTNYPLLSLQCRPYSWNLTFNLS